MFARIFIMSWLFFSNPHSLSTLSFNNWQSTTELPKMLKIFLSELKELSVSREHCLQTPAKKNRLTRQTWKLYLPFWHCKLRESDGWWPRAYANIERWTDKQRQCTCHGSERERGKLSENTLQPTEGALARLKNKSSMNGKSVSIRFDADHSIAEQMWEFVVAAVNSIEVQLKGFEASFIDKTHENSHACFFISRPRRSISNIERVPKAWHWNWMVNQNQISGWIFDACIGSFCYAAGC